MSSVFNFKHFSIDQTNAPFKVGTDGVLLGAWCEANQSSPKNLLDIGTGTGVIALMLAQRFESPKVDAIEINPLAADIAKKNFESSNWKDRLTVINQPIQDFKTKKLYDLIVCNPPFFVNSLRSGNTGKDTARHDTDFSLSSIFHFASKQMRPRGTFALVLPADRKEGMLSLSSKYDFHISKITDVLPTPTSNPKRILIELKKEKCHTQTERLTIEEFGRHGYSSQYKELTRDFYLKF